MDMFFFGCTYLPLFNILFWFSFHSKDNIHFPEVRYWIEKGKFEFSHPTFPVKMQGVISEIKLLLFRSKLGVKKSSSECEQKSHCVFDPFLMFLCAGMLMQWNVWVFMSHLWMFLWKKEHPGSNIVLQFSKTFLS